MHAVGTVVAVAAVIAVCTRPCREVTGVDDVAQSVVVHLVVDTVKGGTTAANMGLKRGKEFSKQSHRGGGVLSICRVLSQTVPATMRGMLS